MRVGGLFGALAVIRADDAVDDGERGRALSVQQLVRPGRPQASVAEMPVQRLAPVQQGFNVRLEQQVGGVGDGTPGRSSQPRSSSARRRRPDGR